MLFQLNLREKKYNPRIYFYFSFILILIYIHIHMFIWTNYVCLLQYVHFFLDILINVFVLKQIFLLTLANLYETINSLKTLRKTYKFEYQNLDRKFMDIPLCSQ